MKHYLPNSLRALFLSLAVLLSLPMLAVAVEIDGINYELNAEQATVIAKSSGKYSGEVIIPESVVYEGTAYSVTSIGNDAFSYCYSLTSVTIPNSLTSIGDNAFDGCRGLTSVHISDITTWCNIVFDSEISNPLYYAHHLYLNGEEVKELLIPNGMTIIGDYAFRGCSGLTSVTIPNSVTSIGKSAFNGCSGLISVHISDILAWYNIAFSNSSSNPLCYAHHLYLNGEEIKDLVIPNSVTSIGDYAFRGCSGLTSVTIPNSVTSIGFEAFAYCSGLTSVTIGNGVTSISHHAFSHCSGLTSVTIPNSVTSIGAYAFYACSGLTSVTIPNSVTSIGNYAFDGCSGLTSVHISDIIAWCNIDFATYDSNPLYYAPHLYLNGEEVKDLVIPNSVTSIGDYAFDGFSGLTSVTIPNSVTSIGEYAFDGCSGLTSVTIGNGVTSIGGGAFQSCSGLTSVTIPNSVTSIGGAAFSGCSGLTSVTIPNSVTSIGGWAFSGCSELLNVYCYAEDVPSTESYAFNGIDGEKAILHVPAASLDSYKAIAPWSSFKNIVAITTEVDGINYDFNAGTKQATVIEKSSGKYSGEVVIPESVVYEDAAYSVTSIGDYAFRGCSALTSVTIPNSVTSIGYAAFHECSGLTSVTIGNSVTSIGEAAFYGCTGLTSVHISDIAAWCNIDFESNYSNPLYYAHHLYLNGEEVKDLVIPNSVTSIGFYAFFLCSGLNSVTIGNSVESIGNYAFYECSGLTSVTIPNSVTSIGGRAFYECSGLTSVTIPNSVTSIEWYAFYGCSGLTSVTIGSGVTSIGYAAFSDCSDLLEVYCYAEKVPSTESNAFEDSPIKNATLHVPAVSINSYEASAPWSSFGKIVAISESTSDLVIKDGENFENTEERELGTLTYTRTLPNRYWNPLYVPFKIPYEALKDNYDVAYINSMHSYDNDQNGEIDKMTMEVILVKNGVLKANHPYLIRAKSDNATKMELVLEDVTLYPTVSNKLDCSSVYTHFEITGTYKAMKRADLNGSLVITTSGAWMELSESSELKPFRFYLTITDRPGSPLEVSKESKSRINICVQGEDDFSTGIEETEIGKVKSGNSAVYDLSGRRVQKAQKGIYIQNGKVVVR